MIVSIYVNAYSPASKTFTLPTAFLQGFNVFSCGRSTQANTCALAKSLNTVNIGVHWNYHSPVNCSIYVFALGF